MRQIKRLFPNILFVVLFIMSAAASAALHSDNRLLIIRSGDAPAYFSVERSFRAQLSQRLPQLSRIRSSNLESIEKLESLLTPDALKNTDLIITIGARAAYRVLKKSPEVAVLSVFIPRKTYHSIMDEVAQVVKKKLDRSAIYLDQPDERLVLLAKSISDKKSEVSLLSGPENGSLLKTRSCAGENTANLMSDVKIYRTTVSSRSLKRTLKRSDIVIATPDLVKQSPNAIKWMLYMAYQRNVPVVGYSQAIVDAGAITSVFSTPEDIGRQTAEIFLQYQQAGNKKLHDSTYPSYFQVKVNQSVAEALGYSKLNEENLHKTLMKSALNCKENYVPVPSNKSKQQLTRR